MDNEEQEAPQSRANANKMIRVLTNRPQKFTISVHHADGRVTEWQANESTKVHWDDQDRALWICRNEYGSAPIMRFEQGMIILAELNPDWTDKK